MVLGKFKALNQNPGFELHRDSRKGKKHLDGCSAIRQYAANGVDESKDSTSEIWRPARARLDFQPSPAPSHLISSL
jgi:hypothetical protein